jgi:hypothetical protein
MLSEKTIQIPDIMVGNLPNNLKEFANIRFEKTLNKYQDVIEEMEHRNKSNSYSNDFKNYTRKYFIESVGHDSNSFFKNHIMPDFRDHRNIGRQHNNSFISFGHVNGAEIVVGGATSTSSGDQNLLIGTSGTGGTVGQYYDRIAVDFTVAGGGNINLGLYDDNSNPNNKLSQTGTLTNNDTSFTYKTMTEAALTTTTIWLAFVYDTSSTEHVTAVSSARYVSFSYNATLPSPFSSTTGTTQRHMKITHS